MINFIALCNIQYRSGNRSLKGPAFGSADKYTTLLSLAWLIKLIFHLRILLHDMTFLLNSHWLANFFKKKKSRIQSYFLLFSNESHSVWKIFVNFIQISIASHIYFEATKWCWTNCQMQVALSKKYDLFFNFIFESFKHKVVVFIFPHLIYNSTNEPGWQCLHWENLLESYVWY